MDKTAYSVITAARILWDSGYFDQKEVEDKINALNQPVEGYVYAEDVTAIITFA